MAVAGSDQREISCWISVYNKVGFGDMPDLSLEAEKPIFRQNVEVGGTYSKQLLLCDAIAQDFCQIPILLSIECRLILFFWCGRLQNNGSEIFGLSVLFQIGTPANNHSTSTLDADILVVCSMLHL